MANLLTSQRFLPLFITQFLGAFNDNLLKNALVILITYHLATSAQNAQMLVTLAAGLFILPFFLFSALAGQLADKYDRAKITRFVKLFEILIMCCASVGFWLHDAWFLIGVLFASGVHSTFFGPVKYALLPQQLHANELLLGNAYIEAGTFLAILFGTIYGGILIITQHGAYAVSICLLIVAIAGYISSRYIPAAPPPVPRLKINYNLAQETMSLIRYSRMNKKVMLTIVCISWFWFIGAIFLAQLPGFVKINLHAEAKVVTLLLTLFSIGIGLGSLICTTILRGAIRSTYVPAAALGMSLFIIDLYFCSTNDLYYNVHGLYSIQQFLHFNISWRIILDLTFVAICGGIYIVPLYTILQHIANQTYMARIIASLNIFNALFMVFATLFTLGMLSMHRSIPEIFVSVAIANILIAIYLRRKLNHSST
ncbi:MAG TPA: MFS transporter [Gammaproteobacteria bacterium]|nr:MFS transporter [Gammaproteobacteria bacterium]